MTPAPTASRRLAEWCAALQWQDVPAGLRAQVPLRLLDTLGLILAGAGTEAVAAARAFAEDQAGAPQSTVIGGRKRLPAPLAALVHGIAAHCRDFDDTFPDSVVHPGSVVLPTALAVAEAEASSPAAFGAAVVVGYEVAARVGAVAGRRFHARSLHASGIVGPIAAAAAAGRLRGLDGERIAWAMGLAASMSGGLRAYAIDGGWSKWLHLGWAAQGGIIAADLAARGFRGPEYGLEGGHDLYSALLQGEAVDRSALTDALGGSWRGGEAVFKYYPCAHVIQPYIDAVLGLLQRHRLRAAEVAAIECSIAPWAAAIVCEPRPAKLRFDSELAVTSSLPYQLAFAVAEGRVDLGALEPAARRRADLSALAERVTHRLDPGLGCGFDGMVTLSTTAGATHHARAASAADAGKLREKFTTLARPRLGPAEAEAAAAAILAPGEPEWRRAAALLAAAGPPERTEHALRPQ